MDRNESAALFGGAAQSYPTTVDRRLSDLLCLKRRRAEVAVGADHLAGESLGMGWMGLGPMRGPLAAEAVARTPTAERADSARNRHMIVAQETPGEVVWPVDPWMS